MKTVPRNLPGESHDGAGPVSAADKNSKRLVMALQSGLKSEVSWALNALTVLSFKEKDDPRRDFTAMAKVPGLLDALLFVVSRCLEARKFLCSACYPVVVSQVE